ncbi:MAG: alginate lyase family protein [Planctomycetota bacterium]|nr:alginate lyase family protein [Planctomycetota bacterium]
MNTRSILMFCLVSFMATLGVAESKYPRVMPPDPLPPHPRLFVNQQEIDQLRKWSEQETWLGKYLNVTVEDLRKSVNDPELPTTNRGANVGIARKAHSYAVAYALTGEKPFAEAAAKILNAYVPLFPKYEVTGMKGKASDSTLGECDWAIHAASAYDLIYNSGVLTDAEKQAIEQDVFKPSAEAMRQCNHRYRSNWRGRAIAGVAILGFCIGDRELIDEAINGFWDEEQRLIRDGFVQHVAWSILADGVFYERSVHYQLYTADAYALIAEVARHNGMDLWNLEVHGHPFDAGADIERTFGETGKKTVKAIFDSPFYEAFSDGSLVRLGNSYADRLERTRCYEPAYRAYGDPKYAWLLRRGVKFARPIAGGGYLTKEQIAKAKAKADRTGDAPRRPLGPLELLWLVPDLPEGKFDHGDDATVGVTGRHENNCTLLPNGGITVLREGIDPKSIGVQMTYGDWGSAHTHPELLAITVSAGGHLVIPEVRYHSYGHEDFLSWDRQSIAHNTVTVDEVSQYPQDVPDPWVVERNGKQARGRPLFFRAGEDFKAFGAECDAAYEGVLLSRAVALVDSTIVDFYRCRSASEHTYDFALHIDGTLAHSTIPLSKASDEPLSKSLGYQHLLAPRRGEAKGEDQMQFDTSGGLMQIDLLSSGAVAVATGHADLQGKTKEALVLGQKGKDVDFVDVLSFPDRQEWKQIIEVKNLPEGVLGVRLIAEDNSEKMVLSSETGVPFDFQGVQVAGRMALLEKAVDRPLTLIDQVE